MLFSSYQFIFAFLPTVLAAFALVRLYSARAAVVVLMVASLYFYAAWKAEFLPLLLLSIGGNFLLGLAMKRSRRPRLVLAAGITLNLLALCYFKYALFVAGTVEAAFGIHLALPPIVLPIGISFFTFQQIAYLVDVGRGTPPERDPVSFALFVSFFPHLIAGPLVHHAEMIPQFKSERNRRLAVLGARGLAIAAAGLFKKVVLADGFAQFATPMFTHVDSGGTIGCAWAWIATIAYALQIYFDFSGYSDMAIGLALMFGIRLPVNFRSPYKARSIIDFWRRWHITLSRFLRDYLYVPLGGNRRGTPRRYANVLITMLLGGLWHGAGWTFLAWGALHGFCLVVNHAVRQLRTARPRWFAALRVVPECVRQGVAWAATFATVLGAWVLFRATTLHGALTMLSGLLGLNPTVDFGPRIIRFADLPWVLPNAGYEMVGIVACGVGMAMVLLLPNTAELFRYHEYARAPDEAPGRLRWRPTLVWATAVAAELTVCIFGMWQSLEFLYFQF
jgi:D-alanyl-lipoteichoic acid acyltransferase DltB (MBOAT superfamily)